MGQERAHYILVMFRIPELVLTLAVYCGTTLYHLPQQWHHPSKLRVTVPACCVQVVTAQPVKKVKCLMDRHFASCSQTNQMYSYTILNGNTYMKCVLLGKFHFHLHLPPLSRTLHTDTTVANINLFRQENLFDTGITPLLRSLIN